MCSTSLSMRRWSGAASTPRPTPSSRLPPKKASGDEIDKTDRQRAAYYNYYTQNRWGDVHNYDLSVNAALGKEVCVQMILAAVEAKEKQMG